MIYCETQKEVDYYWDKLSEGGDEKAQQCGWVKDRFGLSWQIVPTALPEMLQGSGRRENEPRHGSFAEDEKARHRGVRASLCGPMTRPPRPPSTVSGRARSDGDPHTRALGRGGRPDTSAARGLYLVNHVEMALVVLMVFVAAFMARGFGVR